MKTLLKKLLAYIVFAIGFMGFIVLIGEPAEDTATWIWVMAKILSIPYMGLIAALYCYLKNKGYIITPE